MLILYSTSNTFHFILNLQIAIIKLIHFENNGLQIGAGIWCGIAFVIAGALTISPGSSSTVTFRKVMLIVSIIFASFFAFWAFIHAFFHAIDFFYGNEYNENLWLRLTQGFCAGFEIILASVTLCQRTSNEQGFVIAAPQTIVLAQPVAQPIYQPAVQMGYQPQLQPAYQPQVQPVYQPGEQPQLQTQAYPQTAPSPYTGQFYG